MSRLPPVFHHVPEDLSRVGLDVVGVGHLSRVRLSIDHRAMPAPAWVRLHPAEAERLSDALAAAASQARRDIRAALRARDGDQGIPLDIRHPEEDRP